MVDRPDAFGNFTDNFIAFVTSIGFKFFLPCVDCTSSNIASAIWSIVTSAMVSS